MDDIESNKQIKLNYKEKIQSSARRIYNVCPSALYAILWIRKIDLNIEVGNGYNQSIRGGKI
jgi:hypothetical protein